MKYITNFKKTKNDFLDVFAIESYYLDSSTIASIESVSEWEKRNKDVHIFVKDVEKNKVIGEITLLPLNEQQFNKFMIDELHDTELGGESLEVYEPFNNYYLLFSVIAIDIDYRDDRKVLSLLLNCMIEKLEHLAKNNINFVNICAEGQTEDGKKFIENFLNLKAKFITKDRYKLYSIETNNTFNNWKNLFKSSVASYDKKYKLSSF